MLTRCVRWWFPSRPRNSNAIYEVDYDQMHLPPLPFQPVIRPPHQTFVKTKITQAGDTIDTFTLPNRKPSSPPRGRQTQNSDCFQLDVVEFDTWHGPYATSHPQTGKQVLECLTCSRKHSSSRYFSVVRDAGISRNMTDSLSAKDAYSRHLHFSRGRVEEGLILLACEF